VKRLVLALVACTQLVGCGLFGCVPGESRCRGGAVETCKEWTGWERTEQCGGMRPTCYENTPSKCHTTADGVACCGGVR
jgi:hypothetical protein